MEHLELERCDETIEDEGGRGELNLVLCDFLYNSIFLLFYYHISTHVRQYTIILSIIRAISLIPPVFIILRSSALASAREVPPYDLYTRAFLTDDVKARRGARRR